MDYRDWDQGTRRSRARHADDARSGSDGDYAGQALSRRSSGSSVGGPGSGTGESAVLYGGAKARARWHTRERPDIATDRDTAASGNYGDSSDYADETDGWSAGFDPWADDAAPGRHGSRDDDTGWRSTETSQWRSTEDSGGWRSATETTGWRPADETNGWRPAIETTNWRSSAEPTDWRSTTGTTGWRSAAESTDRRSATSATAWPSTTDTTDWQTTDDDPEGWRSSSDPPGRRRATISGTAWPTTRDADDYGRGTAGWVDSTDTSVGELSGTAWREGTRRAGRHTDDHDDEPPVRRRDIDVDTSADGVSRRRGGRRRAPDVDDPRPVSGTGRWGGPADSDSWARYTDTGTMPRQVEAGGRRRQYETDTRPDTRRRDINVDIDVDDRREPETPRATGRRRRYGTDTRPDTGTAGRRRDPHARPDTGTAGWRGDLDTRPDTGTAGRRRDLDSDADDRRELRTGTGTTSWRRDVDADDRREPETPRATGRRRRYETDTRPDTWRRDLDTRPDTGTAGWRRDLDSDADDRRRPDTRTEVGGGWRRSADLLDRDTDASGTGRRRRPEPTASSRHSFPVHRPADGMAAREEEEDEPWGPRRSGRSRAAVSAAPVSPAPVGRAGARAVAGRGVAAERSPGELADPTRWERRTGSASYRQRASGVAGPYARRSGTALDAPQLRPRRRIAGEELDGDYQETPGGPLTAVAFTAVWYGVPVVLYVLYMLFLDRSQRAHALTTLADAAPQFGVSLLLSMVVAVALRWAIATWRTASIGLAAAVLGGGLATVLMSAVTGESLG